MGSLNNEVVGISAEIAIADAFSVSIAEGYRNRGDATIAASIQPVILSAFESNGVPEPVEHVAEGQNKVDFKLDGGMTLSVKTNKQKLGKAAPQVVGQASSNTWFAVLAEKLGIEEVPRSYPQKVDLFKIIVSTRIAELLGIYWEYMFGCDFLVQIFNIVDDGDCLTGDPDYVVFKKANSPIWKREKITFTKAEVSEWNESNTVKYDGVTIGEFQVHNNRDNFKFRFDMSGIIKLSRESRLEFAQS